MSEVEDLLNRFESSAHAMQMQGDVNEEGYAERILKLISVVRIQREALEFYKHESNIQVDAMKTIWERLDEDDDQYSGPFGQRLRKAIAKADEEIGK